MPFSNTANYIDGFDFLGEDCCDQDRVFLVGDTHTESASCDSYLKRFHKDFHSRCTTRTPAVPHGPQMYPPSSPSPSFTVAKWFDYLHADCVSRTMSEYEAMPPSSVGSIAPEYARMLHERGGPQKENPTSMVSSYETIPPVLQRAQSRPKKRFSPSLKYELELWKRREAFFRQHSMSQNEIKETRKHRSLSAKQTRSEGKDCIESNLEDGQQKFFDRAALCCVAVFPIAIILWINPMAIIFGQGWEFCNVGVLFFFFATVLLCSALCRRATLPGPVTEPEILRKTLPISRSLKELRTEQTFAGIPNPKVRSRSFSSFSSLYSSSASPRHTAASNATRRTAASNASFDWEIELENPRGFQELFPPEPPPQFSAYPWSRMKFGHLQAQSDT